MLPASLNPSVRHFCALLRKPFRPKMTAVVVDDYCARRDFPGRSGAAAAVQSAGISMRLAIVNTDGLMRVRSLGVAPAVLMNSNCLCILLYLSRRIFFGVGYVLRILGKILKKMVCR